MTQHITTTPFADLLATPLRWAFYHCVEGIVVEVSKKRKILFKPGYSIWNVTISDGKYGLPLTCVDMCEADEERHAPLTRIGERVAVTNLTMNRRFNTYVGNNMVVTMSLTPATEVFPLPFYWYGSGDDPHTTEYSGLHKRLFVATWHRYYQCKAYEPVYCITRTPVPPKHSAPWLEVVPKDVWRLILAHIREDPLTLMMLFYACKAIRPLVDGCVTQLPNPFNNRYRFNTHLNYTRFAAGRCKICPCCLWPGKNLSAGMVARVIDGLCSTCSGRPQFQLVVQWSRNFESVEVPAMENVPVTRTRGRVITFSSKPLYWKAEIPCVTKSRKRKLE